MKEAVIAKPPHLQGIPRVDFMHLDYNALLYNKGYIVTVEPAFPCPCAMRQGSYQSSCSNCQGTGWVFGTPTEMRAVLSSINSSTKYKEWSAENAGTVNVTVESRFRMAFMDRLTVKDSMTIDAENVIVKKRNDEYYANTVYPIKEVEFAFLFKTVDVALDKLVFGTDFLAMGNKLLFNTTTVKEGDSITIRYRHEIAYAIIDVNHDVRNTYRLDYSSQELQNELPVSAVARKFHYVVDGANFLGNNILYNKTS